MPRVSVVIATYNWSSVLPYSVGSALGQTFADLEVLVVGDGCSDDSAQVVAAIGDSRVRWINLPSNSGHQSAPNNEGLRQSRGEIIAYLGHDDLWLPRHLELLIAALDAQRADLAYSLAATVDAEDRVWPVLPSPSHGSFSPPSATIHRRRMAEEMGGWRNHREIPLAPDVDFVRRADAAGFRLVFVPRLTAIKFPASWRKNVYRLRPHHQQAAWSARIAAEPDFEAALLSRLIIEDQVPTGLTYRDLMRHVFSQTISRLRRRLLLPSRRRTIEELRRFKGL